ncbi:MAG: SusC/RagA family TonB-linked outer membrane protein [Gemmatimonadota bacterium]|nr:SusC/RagA family TonB-linked outer membrane protein [Gemmatimonadota bacterium]
MKRSTSVLLLAFLMASLPPGLAAQDAGVLTGQVTDAATGAPIASAQIFILGTGRGTLTNSEGRYLLAQVPVGEYELQAELIGFAASTQPVTVVAGQTTITDFSLSVTALQLDELVVTGTAGVRLRREQPATIAQVDAAALTEFAPISNVADVLQSRLPGVSMKQGNGQSGAGQVIHIRGVSSISLSNQPLIYIDGVRIDSRNEVARPDGEESSPATSFDATGGGAAGRLNDLNPYDIESVEIVKGPAAATLYGADASAGVIQIITKRGGEGDFRQNIQVEFNSIDMSFDLKENWAACTQAAIDAGAYLCRGQAVGTLVSDNPLERAGAFRKGNRWSTSWSGRGGGEGYGYFTSLNWIDEDGTISNNYLESLKGRLNFDWQPHETLRFEAGYALGKIDNNLPMSNHSPLGIPTSGYLGNPLSLMTPDDDGCGFGKCVGILEAEHYVRTLRNTLSLTTRHAPLDWFNQWLTLGGDFTRTERRQFFPKNDQGWYFGEINSGYVDENRNSFENVTVDYLANAQFSFGGDDQWSSDVSAGLQFIRRREEFVVSTGVGLTTNTARTVSAATERAGAQWFQDNRSLGYLAQYQLGYRDRLFLQVGARWDQNSSFGEAAPVFFLPKVGISWVLSDEPFWRETFPWMDQFRLRGALGTTGRAPEEGVALRTYDPAPYVSGPNSIAPGVRLANPGNPDLTAERGTEFEAGFDLALLRNRLGVEFTYFNKTTNDLILEKPVSPSLGFLQNPLVNIGEVLNRGVEVAVRSDIVRRPNLAWSVNVGMNTLYNELVSLGGLEAFGNRGRRFVEGLPLGSAFVRTIRRVEADRTIVSDTLEYGGDGIPDFEGSFQSNLTLFEVLDIRGQLDWKTGFQIRNSTDEFRETSIVRARERLDESVLSPEERRRRYGPFYSESGSSVPISQADAVYLQDGDFLRLRELTVSVSLPQEVLARIGAQSGRFTVGGRNLALWTGYEGVDPETTPNILNSERASFGSYSFFTLPPPRRLITRISLAF